MDVSLDTTEACLEKIEDNQGKVENKMEADLEEAAVETIGALRDRSRDRRLLVRRRGRPKNLNQGDGGLRQKLAVTRGRITRRAIPAPCKAHGLQGPGRDNVASGASEGRTLQERSSGIKDRDLKEQLRLRKEGHPAESSGRP
jgi:hypothetical protein